MFEIALPVALVDPPIFVEEDSLAVTFPIGDIPIVYRLLVLFEFEFWRGVQLRHVYEVAGGCKLFEYFEQILWSTFVADNRVHIRLFELIGVVFVLGVHLVGISRGGIFHLLLQQLRGWAFVFWGGMIRVIHEL